MASGVSEQSRMNPRTGKPFPDRMSDEEVAFHLARQEKSHLKREKDASFCDGQGDHEFRGRPGERTCQICGAGAPDNIKEQGSGDPKAAHEKWMADTQPESGGTIRAKRHVAKAKKEISQRLAAPASVEEAAVQDAYRKVIATLDRAMSELEDAETEESYTLDT